MYGGGGGVEWVRQGLELSPLRKPKGAQAVIYTLAGHPQSSAWCVMTCNHRAFWCCSSLCLAAVFLAPPPSQSPTPWLYGLSAAFGGLLFNAMNEFASTGLCYHLCGCRYMCDGIEEPKGFQMCVFTVKPRGSTYSAN